MCEAVQLAFDERKQALKRLTIAVTPLGEELRDVFGRAGRHPFHPSST
jgi:hypothetical protein